jgi:hypothetical protein
MGRLAMGSELGSEFVLLVTRAVGPEVLVVAPYGGDVLGGGHHAPPVRRPRREVRVPPYGVICGPPIGWTAGRCSAR